MTDHDKSHVGSRRLHWSGPLRLLAWWSFWALSLALTWFLATEGQKEWRPIVFDTKALKQSACLDVDLTFWVDAASPMLPEDGGLTFKVWSGSKHVASIGAYLKVGEINKRVFLKNPHKLVVGTHEFVFEMDLDGSIDWSSDFAQAGFIVHPKSTRSTAATFFSKLDTSPGVVSVNFEYLMARSNEDVLRDIACFWDVVEQHWRRKA